MLPLIPVIATAVSVAIVVNETYEVWKLYHTQKRLRKNYGVRSEAEFKRKYKISLGAYERMVEIKKMFDANKLKPSFGKKG